jgi:hypothetical protein
MEDRGSENGNPSSVPSGPADRGQNGSRNPTILSTARPELKFQSAQKRIFWGANGFGWIVLNIAISLEVWTKQNE